MTSQLNLFPNYFVREEAVSLHAWADLSHYEGETPVVMRNSSGDVEIDWSQWWWPAFSAGALIAHPGFSGEYSHVVFTAPSFGQYTVAVTFYAQQLGCNSDVAVLVKGGVQFSDTITTYPQSRSFARRYLLNAGEKVDFAVGPNGTVGNWPRGTGLEIVITGEQAD